MAKKANQRLESLVLIGMLVLPPLFLYTGSLNNNIFLEYTGWFLLLLLLLIRIAFK